MIQCRALSWHRGTNLTMTLRESLHLPDLHFSPVRTGRGFTEGSGSFGRGIWTWPMCTETGFHQWKHSPFLEEKPLIVHTRSLLQGGLVGCGSLQSLGSSLSPHWNWEISHGSPSLSCHPPADGFSLARSGLANRQSRQGMALVPSSVILTTTCRHDTASQLYEWVLLPFP